MSSEPTPLRPHGPHDSRDERARGAGDDAAAAGARATGEAVSTGRMLGGVAIAVVATALAVFALVWARRSPERVEPPVVLPLVRTTVAEPQTRRMFVTAYGSVEPRTESDLVAEVRGRIVRVSPSLVAGGFFEAGEELLALDAREARIAVDRARAQVKLRASESKLAAADAERRRQLAERGAASAADLEQFESRAQVARAQLEEARAQLAQAELDLERTVLRAPFEGRVRERFVDLGQFVNPGARLARIYAVDYAEVRLPISTDELVHLDVPLGIARRERVGETLQPAAADAPTDAGESGGVGSPVALRAQLGGRDVEWEARLVRTEGEIDARTRTLHVVARVDDPYGLHGAPTLPLPAGLFVEARIRGREREDVYVLPTAALRDGDRVYVVERRGEDEVLRMRDVELARRGASEIVVASGLAPGERVVVSPLRAAIDGMRLRVKDDAAPAEGPAS